MDEQPKEIDKITHIKKSAFLVAYSQCGSISGAAKAAKVARFSHYKWMQSDTDYARAFEEAHVIATDALEEEARRRGALGVLEPIYYLGKKVGTKRVYSDTLLIFLLKGNNPEKFKDRAQVDLGGRVTTTDLDLSKLPADRLRELETILSEAAVDGPTSET